MRAEGKAQDVHIGELLSAERVFDNVQANDKRGLLRKMAHDAAAIVGLNEVEIENALVVREKLGSTGLGQGIAIPHARMAGLRNAYCALYRLMKPINFDAIDDMPVDIAALLLIPQADERAGIRALSCVARTLKSPELLAGIRARSGPLSELALAPAGQSRRI